MSFLALHLWPALAAAFVAGLAAGAFGTAARPMSRSGRARVAVTAVAFAAAIAAAWRQALPGEAGLWLDGGVLMVAAYVAGCAVGWVPSRLLYRQPAEAPPTIPSTAASGSG